MEWIHLFPELLTGIGTIVAAWAAFAAQRQSRRNNEKLNSIEIRVDGRLTELLELTATSQHAAGKEEQRAETAVQAQGEAR